MCTAVAGREIFIFIISSMKAQGGGAHVKILTGMLVLFFGFEIWPNPIFLAWVGKIFSYFSGFPKISAIFLGLTNFLLFFGSFNFCVTQY